MTGRTVDEEVGIDIFRGITVLFNRGCVELVCVKFLSSDRVEVTETEVRNWVELTGEGRS